MNLGKMMKDLQKMQARLQSDIETLEVEGTSGGGMISARMNGKKQLLSLELAAEAITPDDPELLEDLLIAAVNDAVRKVDDRVQQLTQGLAPGLRIPGL